MNSSNSSSNIRTSIDSNLSSTFKFGSIGNMLTNSKARNFSSNPSLRITSTGLSSKQQQDPRPLLEKSFQNTCSNKVFSFLVSNSYPFVVPSNSKWTLTLGKNDYIKLFCFIMSFIRKDYEVKISKIEEDLPRIVTELGYPGILSKHTLLAIGAPNSNGQLIGLLAWMVELAEYFINYEDLMLEDLEKIEIYKENQKSMPSTEDKELQNIINSQKETSFLLNAHSELSTSNNFNKSKSQFEEKIKQTIEEKQTHLGLKLEKIEKIKSENTQIKSHLLEFSKLSGKINNLENDIKMVDNNLSNTDVKISLANTEYKSIQEEEKVLLIRKDKLISEEERLTRVVNNQEMTKEIYEKKQQVVNKNKSVLEEKEKSINTLNNEVYSQLHMLSNVYYDILSNLDITLNYLLEQNLQYDSIEDLKEISQEINLLGNDYSLISNPIENLIKYANNILSVVNKSNDISSETKTCEQILSSYIENTLKFISKVKNIQE